MATELHTAVPHPGPTVHRRRSVRAVYLALGFVSLAVVALSWLPLIPTTGPALLAAFFFARSSERFHKWLMDNPVLGPTIRTYQGGAGIPARAKVTAVVLIVATFGLSVGFLLDGLVLRVSLVALAAGIVAFILTRPTAPAP